MREELPAGSTDDPTHVAVAYATFHESRASDSISSLREDLQCLSAMSRRVTKNKNIKLKGCPF